MLSYELHVAQRRSHQEVGTAAAGDQVARHFLAVTHHVLSRRGFVVDNERVAVGSVVQQILGDLDRRGELQRSLPVATASVH